MKTRDTWHGVGRIKRAQQLLDCLDNAVIALAMLVIALWALVDALLATTLARFLFATAGAALTSRIAFVTARAAWRGDQA